jgi:hypothetical protein
MPDGVAVRLLRGGIIPGACVDLLVLDRADSADFRVVTAKLTLRVQNGVDMKRIGGGASRELSKTVNELLLELIGEFVLGTEEDDTAFGDWGCQLLFYGKSVGAVMESLLLIARSRISSSALGALSHSTRSTLGNSVPMTGVTSSCSNLSKEPEDFSGPVFDLRVLAEMLISGSIAEGAMVLWSWWKLNCPQLI